MSNVSQLLVPGFGSSVLCHCWMPRTRGMAAYIRDGYGAFCQPKFSIGCCEMLFITVWGVRQKLYVCYPYCNTDLHGRIHDYLLTPMAAVRAEDVCSYFLFVGDLNGHH